MCYEIDDTQIILDKNFFVYKCDHARHKINPKTELFLDLDVLTEDEINDDEFAFSDEDGSEEEDENKDKPH